MSLDEYFDLEESTLTQVVVGHLQMSLELVFAVYRHRVRGWSDDVVVHLRFKGVERLMFMNDYHAQYSDDPWILDEANWSWNEVATVRINDRAESPTDAPGLQKCDIILRHDGMRRIEVAYLQLEIDEVVDKDEFARQMALVGATP